MKNIFEKIFSVKFNKRNVRIFSQICHTLKNWEIFYEKFHRQNVTGVVKKYKQTICTTAAEWFTQYSRFGEISFYCQSSD